MKNIKWIFLLVIIAQCQQTKAPSDQSFEDRTGSDLAPKMVWHKGYGTDNGEHIHEVMQTSDGGFLGIGQMSEGEEEPSELLVIKIDSEGEFLWQRIIGTAGEFDVGICVDEASDGYLIGGGLFSGTQQRYLAKLDFEGSTIWEKIYEAPGVGMIRGIAPQENGEIVVTGYKGYSTPGYIFIADNSQGFIMKLDSNGERIWEKPISTAQGAKVRSIPDGFFICTTHYMNDEDTPQEMYLIKLDKDGNELWANNYGGESDEHCYDCDVTDDGGIILGGHTRSPSYGAVNWDFLLMKIDKEGNEEWHGRFGQPRGYDAEWIHDEAYGVRQTADGGYVLIGGTGDEYPYSETGSPKGPSDLWMTYVVKVDGSGNLQWEEVYGSTTSHDAGEYMDTTEDGGIIIGTDSDSAGAEEFEPNNFGFMKIANLDTTK